MLSWILIGLAVFFAALRILTWPHRGCCKQPPVGTLFCYLFFAAYHSVTHAPWWQTTLATFSALIGLEVLAAACNIGAHHVRKWREKRKKQRDFPRAVARLRRDQ